MDSEITFLNEELLAILSSHDIHTNKDLSQQDAKKLYRELFIAHEDLEINLELVQNWILKAKESITLNADQSKEQESQTVDRGYSNYEDLPEVQEMLSGALFAIPLPAKVLVTEGVSVNEIPEAFVLNRVYGDLNIRLEKSKPSNSSEIAPKSAIPKSKANIISIRPEKIEPTTFKETLKPASKFSQAPIQASLKTVFTHQFSDLENRKASIPNNVIPKDDDERVKLLRAPLEETNAGISPNSRRYVKGVLHPQPIKLRLGAISAIIILIHLPLAILSGLLLLASREKAEIFTWVPSWIIIIPILLPISSLFYLICGFTCKCRVCGQKLFVQKIAFKHKKSHRFPLVGYVIPLAFHLLAFSWFRCSSCGTPIRIKK